METHEQGNSALRRILRYVCAIYIEPRDSQYLKDSPGAILWRLGTVRPAVFLPDAPEDEELIQVAEMVARWAEEAP